MFAVLTIRRRWGLALVMVGVVLYALHDRAMRLVAGTASERVVGMTIGLVLPVALVAGGYLVVTPKPAVRGTKKRKKRTRLPSDRTGD